MMAGQLTRFSLFDETIVVVRRPTVTHADGVHFSLISAAAGSQNMRNAHAECNLTLPSGRVVIR